MKDLPYLPVDNFERGLVSGMRGRFGGRPANFGRNEGRAGQACRVWLKKGRSYPIATAERAAGSLVAVLAGLLGDDPVCFVVDFLSRSTGVSLKQSQQQLLSYSLKLHRVN